MKNIKKNKRELLFNMIMKRNLGALAVGLGLFIGMSDPMVA
jgi:hypothetical protein